MVVPLDGAHPAAPRVALVGLGEAGAAIGADMAATSATVTGFDPRVETPAGIEHRLDDADAVRDADVVLSLNSEREAVTALTNSVPGLRSGALWADLNTTSPAVQSELAQIAASAGIEFADVALMAVVPGRGLKTPMLAAGPGAERFRSVVGALGAEVEVVDGPAGSAMARKLLRSVFVKGVAAAAVEALEAARVSACHEWLESEISAELVSYDHRSLERMVTGSRRHACRRSDEMHAAAEHLAQLGVEPRIAGSARDALHAICDENKNEEEQ